MIIPFVSEGRIGSHHGQDSFAWFCNPISDGYYLDLGCGDPVEGSNTFQLDRLGWRGICADRFEKQHLWRVLHGRTSAFPCMHDGITSDNLNGLIKFCPNVIDYASFDMDENNLLIVEHWPFAGRNIACFTFEHDRYALGDRLSTPSRQVFSKLGYDLLCEDVCCEPDKPFEDWWVMPFHCCDPDALELIRSKGKWHRDLLEIMRR